MKFTRGVTIICLLVAGNEAAEWNYKTDQGRDWKDLVIKKDGVETNKCGTTHQSPIDLIRPGSDGAEKYVTVTEKKDDLKKDYGNQKELKVNWNGHTSQVAGTGTGADAVVLEDATKKTSFVSQTGKDVFGAPTDFNSIQFHFHAGSEHTINGVRQDLEMHTVHYPSGTTDAEKKANADTGFAAAAMGIMFSVKSATIALNEADRKIIDKFFDSLKWDDVTTNPKAAEIPYGDLMTLVDMSNRWVYKGSVTTPPCATFVYWNVCSNVYPISQKHFDLFKKQVARGTPDTIPDISAANAHLTAGNFREVQALGDRKMYYVMEDVEVERVDGSVIGLAAALAVVILGLFVVGWLYLSLKNQTPSQRSVQPAEEIDDAVRGNGSEVQLVADGTKQKI